MPEVLLTREEAWEYVNKQFEGNTPCAKEESKRNGVPLHYIPHHYGRCEVRQLLDAIYGPLDK